ncbi:MAG: DUF4340 domain-containing protein [Desulfobacterales bacterium]|nr:DUF4340 domain-containing protein [Desulfobacterales bacterium]
MKKEYLILIVIIAGLSAYLTLKKDDRVHYELPVMTALDTKAIDRVDITRGDTALTLSKGDKGWTVTEEKYPVDQTAMENILSAVKELKLSALVSEAGDKIRYELDAERAIRVNAWAGNTEKRSFIIGKTAPSFNHTFIMLKDDGKIYQADNSFRNDFAKNVDDIRDKLVLSFETETIKKITLEKDGVTRTLVLNAPAPSGEDKTENPGEAKGAWLYDDGAPADKTAAEDLLSSLSHLECQSYLKPAEAKAIEKETAQCKISLENGSTLSLNLFEKAKGESVAGLSSSTPYAFALDSYKAKDIVSYADKLLGLEKKDAEADKK